ncbi:MAG: outer membrane protein assembly factor BamE [Caulobacterales bacterium]|nr:outer membrane protein assembly factor BamE [Caulobacterales bacterium]
MSVALRAAFLASAVLAIAACSPQVSRHGFQPVDVQPADIVVGTDTRDTVQARLGSPSVVSTFEPESVWFYISQTTAKYTFNLPEVTQRSVTQITFDDSGRVIGVENLNLEDGRELAFNDRETPTRGRELTVLEQLLGTVGRQALPNAEEDLPPNQRRRRE